MRPLRAAILGMGYIGVSHIDAVRRLAGVELVCVADTNYPLAQAKAALMGVPKCYRSIDEVIADPDIDVIHNCTPNHLHTEINQAVLRAGKHLFTEKPLATTYAEAKALLATAMEHPQAAAGVNFTYRMNPLVQEMRARVARGDLGALYAVTGCYLQDWLLYDTDYSWRLEPEAAGPSCCLADIGSHWMDLVQHVSGHRIVEVMADTRTTIPVRKKPTAQTETFSSGAPDAYEAVPVANEDYASVLFHMDSGTAGAFTVSEVSAGHGCYFQVEFGGAKESFRWNQEENDRLWIGRRDADNSLLLRDPNCLTPEARAHTSLAKGHPEGWNDAFLGNIRAFYRYVQAGLQGSRDFATLEEAAYIVRLTEACIRSAKARAWVNV